MTDLTPPEHDTYVFQLGRRYSWNCPCGARPSKPFDRRMDADDDANEHEESTAPGGGA